jgi:Domain of unknown function (DUF4351)
MCRLTTRTLEAMRTQAMKMPPKLEDRLKRDVYEAKEKKMPYLSTIERMAKQDGLQDGLLSAVELLLLHRFGELSEKLRSSLKKLSPDQIRALLVAQQEFKAKTDLHQWLKQHAGENGAPRARTATRTKK